MTRTFNFKISHHKKTLLAFAAALGFVFIVSAAQPVFAQACLPGLPCETLPTATQLADPSTGPNADKTTSTMCDANFMNQIYAKAFLEAEREVVINNALMLKPDSVLEYSCFDQQAARVAENGGPIFSERNWTVGGTSVNMGNTRLDDSINRLVLSSLSRYVSANFAHDFLGGAAGGSNNTISSTVAGTADITTDPCDFMYLVHDVSKCDDFALNTRFMTFESFFSTPALLSTDPRTLPVTCPAGTQITSARLNIARNAGWTYASFDPVDTLLPPQRPLAASACASAALIRTGVIVSVNRKTINPLDGRPVVTALYEYPEQVCANPGCSFDHRDDADPSNDRCIP